MSASSYMATFMLAFSLIAIIVVVAAKEIEKKYKKRNVK